MALPEGSTKKTETARKSPDAREERGVSCIRRREEIEQARRDLMLAALESLREEDSAEPSQEEQACGPASCDGQSEAASSADECAGEPCELAESEPATLPDSQLHCVMADIVRQDMASLRNEQERHRRIPGTSGA